MSNLDETDFVLAGSQTFENAVNAIAGQSEDCRDSPINQTLNEYVGNGFLHDRLPNLVFDVVPGFCEDGTIDAYCVPITSEWYGSGVNGAFF